MRLCILSGYTYIENLEYLVVLCYNMDCFGWSELNCTEHYPGRSPSYKKLVI